ncbi:hypothetical protein, partial [Streptococcus equinus]|uniref:hypothetical protein n=1 Tax=Streptococcus equinus TaxID=1335 RepID=UPI001F2AEF39
LTGYFRNPHVWFVLFSFQRSLSHLRQLLYSIKFFSRCQQLFQSFFKQVSNLIAIVLSQTTAILV